MVIWVVLLICLYNQLLGRKMVIWVMLLICLTAQLHGGEARKTEFSYGYTDVRPGAHMFWVYYKSPQRVSSTSQPWPTILWLQGGPGVSGVGRGNFLEIGPLDVNFNPRNSTWLQVADLIFVDSPVGVGYSYVEDESALARTDLQVALDMEELLKEVSMEIPALSRSPLYLVGESYGGKIAAKIGVLMVKAISAGSLNLKLGGVVLGGSWISPDDHALSYPLLLQSMSRLDDNAAGNATRMGVTLKQQIAVGQSTEAFNMFTNLMKWIDEKSGNVNIEDIRLDSTVSSMLDLVPRPNPNTNIVDIMNGVVKDEWKTIPKNITWEDVAIKVYNNLTGDFMKPAICSIWSFFFMFMGRAAYLPHRPASRQ